MKLRPDFSDLISINTVAACETTDVCKTEQPVVPPLPVIGLFQRLRGKSRGLLLPPEASSLQSVPERRRLRGVSLRSQPPPSPLPRLVGTRRGAKKRKWVDGKAVVYMRGTSGALCGRPGCLYLIVLLSHRWDLVSPFKFCDKQGGKTVLLNSVNQQEQKHRPQTALTSRFLQKRSELQTEYSHTNSEYRLLKYWITFILYKPPCTHLFHITREAGLQSRQHTVYPAELHLPVLKPAKQLSQQALSEPADRTTPCYD